MNDEELARLKDEDEWDFEAAERQRAPRGRRAIVSVGFKPADFALVSEAAERRDRPLSQFIREAAIDRARGHDAEGETRQVRTITIQAGSMHLEAALLDAMRSHGR